MLSTKIDVDKIREVIGKGGSVIQKIVAESGAKIDIDDDGTIHIASPDAESCEKAKKCIDDIVFVPEVGQLYYGRVVRLMQFGAFVEIAPGKDGLVHISKLDRKRVEKVEDVVTVGDMIWVKFMEIDEKGRWNLSRKDALIEIEAQQAAAKAAARAERAAAKKAKDWAAADAIRAQLTEMGWAVKDTAQGPQLSKI